MDHNLPKWRCKADGSELGALKIDDLEVQKWQGRVLLMPAGRRRITLSYEEYARDKPGKGWYLLQHENGRTVFFPPVPFEQQFEPVPA